jgi:hypothetical protein
MFLGTAALAVGLVGASVEADERSQAADAAAREATREAARAQASVARFENERGKRFEAASAALRGMALPFSYSENFSQTELWVELVRAWSADEFLVPVLQHQGPVFAAAFDPTGERVVTASDDNTARIWRALPTGQPLVEEILAILGPHAPEPLKLPENTNRRESYVALMAKGTQTIVARAQSWLQRTDRRCVVRTIERRLAFCSSICDNVLYLLMQGR